MPLYRHTKLPPPPELGEKSLWDYLPRQTTRRVLFLLIALGAVIVIKRSSGWSFGGLLDAPPAPARDGDLAAPVYHIKVTRPPPPEGPASKSAP
jgi:hypothetical protein